MSWPHSDAAHPATAIRTASGRLVDLAAFRPEDALLSDIATSLAHQDRYTGHCPLHPTVAQHSLAVEHIALYLMPDELGDIDPAAACLQLSRAALMHDAAEAYTSDLSAPMKRALRAAEEDNEYDLCSDERKSIEGFRSPFDYIAFDIDLAITRRFDCSPAGWEGLIHAADVLAWQYESAWNCWSPSAAHDLPAWLRYDPYVQRCYRAPNQMQGGMPYKDGGLAAFLRRAAALGLSDA